MPKKRKPLDFLDETAEGPLADGELPEPTGRLPPPPPPKASPQLPRGEPPAPRAPAPVASPPLRPPFRQEEIPHAPPLFIKLEKYHEVVRELQNLKSYALSLRDAMDVLADVEAELQEGIRVANKALDMFNTILSLLDSKLLKSEEVGAAPQIPEEMETYITNVHTQLEKIRKDLKSLSV